MLLQTIAGRRPESRNVVNVAVEWAQGLVWSDSYQQAAYALLTHLID